MQPLSLSAIFANEHAMLSSTFVKRVYVLSCASCPVNDGHYQFDTCKLQMVRQKRVLPNV